MEECMVARNAICIIKCALSRAKNVQQTALNTQQTRTAPNAQGNTELRQPTSDEATLAQPGDFNDIIPEGEVEESSYDNFGDDLNWLDTNPNPFDDYQQALFWTTWGQEVDLLGT